METGRQLVSSAASTVKTVYWCADWPAAWREGEHPRHLDRAINFELEGSLSLSFQDAGQAGIVDASVNEFPH